MFNIKIGTIKCIYFNNNHTNIHMVEIIFWINKNSIVFNSKCIYLFLDAMLDLGILKI